MAFRRVGRNCVVHLLRRRFYGGDNLVDCEGGMKKKRYKYMHTIDDHPGHYYPGEQICFAVRTRPIPLCDSLEQIKREQRASDAWRIKNGFSIGDRRFGWVKVFA